MIDIVEVVVYDAEWPNMFETEANLIKSVLGDNCIAIHHIGSTAVPGLSAKPILDILPVVKDILQVDQCNSAMKSIGYEVKGEFGIPFRRYFQKSSDRRTHNVHVFEESNPEIERHLKFRDWMRIHSNDRNAYSALKVKLALKYPNNIMKYCLGKDDFIADIDSKAGFDGLRIVQALTEREWRAVRQLRQKYFFDHVPVEDPYTWTFKDAQHVHFVLYKGTKIIGYAHIQLWPENRAAMRIIVIDELYRHKNIGSQFLKLCERWLSYQKIEKLLIRSSRAAYKFYCDNGYVEMPFNDLDGYVGDLQDIEVGKNLKRILI
jgi:GrpB-like predicted nucleotidyltransferase (UPF0157 family)/N-acetylglutamate synthase-like GNAT family acetyltransferase